LPLASVFFVHPDGLRFGKGKTLAEQPTLLKPPTGANLDIGHLGRWNPIDGMSGTTGARTSSAALGAIRVLGQQFKQMGSS
jgi:hypothetical protein